MQYSLTQLVEPAAEPVSLADAREHTQLAHTCDDVLLSRLIAQARELVERRTNRRLVTQQVRLGLEACRLGRVIELPIGPVTAINAAEVRVNNTWQTITAPNLVGGSVQKAWWPAGATFPSPDEGPEPVALELTVGYGALPAHVPAALRGAVLMLVSHYFENREAMVIGTTASELPQGVESILALHTIPVYG